MTKQSKGDFVALWERQLGCANQYEPGVRESVWEAMLQSDPVGATWGTGVRRAPNVTSWGWTREEIAEILTENGHPTASDDPRLTDDFCTEFASEGGACDPEGTPWPTLKGNTTLTTLATKAGF